MMIQVLHRDATAPVCYTPLQFHEAMGLVFLSQLQFENPETLLGVRKRCAKEVEKRCIAPRQKWLGSYYAKEIASDFLPDVTITWIDEVLGYGVITNRDLPARAYIGEYTGVLRKQRIFKKIKNDFCFEYTLGAGTSHSPYLIDAEQQGNHTRFINHSVQANLETSSVLYDGLMHIILYTTQEIPKGAQLCYDYGGNYWRKRKPLLIVN